MKLINLYYYMQIFMTIVTRDASLTGCGIIYRGSRFYRAMHPYGMHPKSVTLTSKTCHKIRFHS